MTTLEFDALLVACGLPASPAVLDAPGLSTEEADRLVAALTACGVLARVLDGTALKGKADLLGAVAKAFDFPGYFGNNWDALVDCWSDMSWAPAPGYVCVLTGADALRKAGPKVHDEFVTVCHDVAERWAGDPDRVVFRLVHGVAAKKPAK
jgi:RNAse (barnase) inhibitor barstar